MTEPMYDNEDVENGLLHDQRRNAVTPILQEASTYPNSITCRERLKKLSFLITGNDYAFFSANPQIEEALKMYVEAAAPFVPQEAAPLTDEECFARAEREKAAGEVYSLDDVMKAADADEATAPDEAMRVARQIVKRLTKELKASSDRNIDNLVALGLQETKAKLAEQRLQEAQAELELLKQLERSTSPCGHVARYAYTENGGKNIVCLWCELRQREAELEQAREVITRGLELAKIVREEVHGLGAPMFPWEIDAATLLAAIPSPPKEAK